MSGLCAFQLGLHRSEGHSGWEDGSRLVSRVMIFLNCRTHSLSLPDMMRYERIRTMSRELIAVKVK